MVDQTSTQHFKLERSVPSQRDELVRTLELYADPLNWTTDGRFVPVMKHIDADDPCWPARQTLNRLR